MGVDPEPSIRYYPMRCLLHGFTVVQRFELRSCYSSASTAVCGGTPCCAASAGSSASASRASATSATGSFLLRTPRQDCTAIVASSPTFSDRKELAFFPLLVALMHQIL